MFRDLKCQMPGWQERWQGARLARVVWPPRQLAHCWPQLNVRPPIGPCGRCKQVWKKEASEGK